MDLKTKNELKKTAVKAAHAAGNVLTKHFGKKLNITRKKGAGLVTNADFEAERTSIRILKKDFPDFGIIGEEQTVKNANESSPYKWIIDPLDGTTNFVHGLPFFCVSIAAYYNDEPLVGIIYHPPMNDLYTAISGKGAYLNSKRMSVSKRSRLKDSLLATGFAYTKNQSLRRDIEVFEKVSQTALGIRRAGSAALDLAYTARGVFDGFWEKNLQSWDVGAGALLVEEAGGKVTSFSGSRFKVNDRQILATNRQLHSKLLRYVKPYS